ncbi:hypothetical protein ABB25_06955 [Stenotrophomonas koreensis]|uniref:Uncharacterized protein n=1 Tax=Stenotrophomonas koreensis TaxID=266128 RepID=A0A0R0BMW5_9GAMM|nr:hypothetical protein ABB25_06955 [Stenotrophomonas koreensis]
MEYKRQVLQQGGHLGGHFLLDVPCSSCQPVEILPYHKGSGILSTQSREHWHFFKLKLIRDNYQPASCLPYNVQIPSPGSDGSSLAADNSQFSTLGKRGRLESQSKSAEIVCPSLIDRVGAAMSHGIGKLIRSHAFAIVENRNEGVFAGVVLDSNGRCSSRKTVVHDVSYRSFH